MSSSTPVYFWPGVYGLPEEVSLTYFIHIFIRTYENVKKNIWCMAIILNDNSEFVSNAHVWRKIRLFDEKKPGL